MKHTDSSKSLKAKNKDILLYYIVYLYAPFLINLCELTYQFIQGDCQMAAYLATDQACAMLCTSTDVWMTTGTASRWPILASFPDEKPAWNETLHPGFCVDTSDWVWVDVNILHVGV